jgi:hypothetical protein
LRPVGDAWHIGVTVAVLLSCLAVSARSAGRMSLAGRRIEI